MENAISTENSGRVLTLRCKQFSESPDMVGNSCFHTGRNPQTCVYPAEVIVRKMEGNRRF